MFDRLKQKWNITSAWQFWAIMLTFTLAGMSITQVRRPLFHLMGIESETPFWLKTIIYLLSLFPLYQIFLMIYGTLLGQFRFFWEKEKAMGRWIWRRLSIPASKPDCST